MTVEGGSSDHMILDITDCKEDFKVGDIIEFDMYYQAMLYSVNSRGVTKRYVEY